MTRFADLARPLAGALLLALLVPGPARAQGPSPASGPAALAMGDAMPTRDVSMRNVDGSALTLASAAGKKGTLVLFICNHCPWVRAWQSRIAALGNDAVGRGVAVIAVNSNDPAAFPEDAFDGMVQRARDAGYHFPYVVDATSDVARAFGATHTPEAFLFDARGRLVYHGAVDDNAQRPDAVKAHWLADAVAAVAAGKPVPRPETKALGCGIKYRVKTST